MAVINKTNANMDFPLQIGRQYGAPIEKFEVFYSFEAAQEYATTSKIAYVGQSIKVVDEANNSVATYVIKDLAGNLDQLGSSGDVSALSGEVNTLKGKVGTLETKVSTIEDTTIPALQKADKTNADAISALDKAVVKKTGSQTITGDLTIVKEGSNTGNLVVGGDLTVKGKTITKDVETLKVKDNLIVTNGDGADLGTALSGMAIKTSATEAYGVVYDPADSSVKLGKGAVGGTESDASFTFADGEGAPIVVRDDAASMTDGNLTQWDGTSKKLKTSTLKVADIALKNELPSGFTITASSNILGAVAGGKNSVTINAAVSASAVAGKLTQRTAGGDLEYGGNIYANGVKLTGNLGTVTSITGGEGLTGGTITTTGTLAHYIPEAGTDDTNKGTNEGAVVLQNLDLDKFGHVVTAHTKTLADVAVSGSYNDLSNKPTALKNPNALSFGTKTYDGSAAATITADDLGALTNSIFGYTGTEGTAVQLDDSGKAYVVAKTYSAAADGGLALSGTAFSIKDKGVTTAKLADSAVTTAKILDANVTDAKIASVNANKLFQSDGDYLFFNCGNASGF